MSSDNDEQISDIEILRCIIRTTIPQACRFWEKKPRISGPFSAVDDRGLLPVMGLVASSGSSWLSRNRGPVPSEAACVISSLGLPMQPRPSPPLSFPPKRRLLLTPLTPATVYDGVNDCLIFKVVAGLTGLSMTSKSRPWSARRSKWIARRTFKRTISR
jgi:hypothetical protein